MNRSTFAAAAALMLAAISAPAYAGVVITQTQSAATPGGDRKADQTIMIQGNKQKIVTGDRQVIIDLDAGKMYMIQAAQSSYLEVPFPPQGPIKEAVAHAAGAMDFKKGTSTQTILGYPCTDYTGSGTSMGGQYTVTECFSTKAPGAKEFTAYQKTLAEKLKGMVPANNTPDGIPLASDSVVKMGSMMQGMGAQQKMGGERTMTTKTTVTNVEVKNLPADTFEVPKGYTQRQMPQMPMGGGPAGAKPPMPMPPH